MGKIKKDNPLFPEFLRYEGVNSITSYAVSMVKFLGKKIFKKPENIEGTDLRKKEIIQTEAKKIIEESEKIISILETTKEALVSEYGFSGMRFLVKPLDLIIDNTKELQKKTVSTLENPPENTDEINSAEKLVEQAKKMVVSYVIFFNKEKVLEKVAEYIIDVHKREIDQDIAILRTNAQELLMSEDISPDQAMLLEQQLSPIFFHLTILRDERFEFNDLRERIEWKRRIDEQRGMLVQLGLLAIDTFLVKASIISEAQKFSDISLNVISEEKIYLDSLEIKQCLIIEKCIMHIRSVIEDPSLTKEGCYETHALIDDIREYLLQMLKGPIHSFFEQAMQELFLCLDEAEHKLSKKMQKFITH